jgi:aryl-alcohol dehydrogenase-like predicted oxidoreductase
VHTPIDETMAALEDLVRAGKVRYIGVSNTPAWKVAEANGIARRRGWSAFIGLQIEYSLLERSVEQELVPMASELGLGVTSTIIGARRLAQLEDNVKALDVDLAHLDELTKPTFGFPQNMQALFPAIDNGGTTINGLYAPPMIMQPGEKPY